MAGKVTEWPSNRGPISKIWPSDGCKGDTVPLAVGQWYNFHSVGCRLGNVGLERHGIRRLQEAPVDTGRVSCGCIIAVSFWFRVF
jgi:hypothetical protein